MELSLERLEILLLIASIVAIAARRLRVPYTVGLVLAGWFLASRSIAPNIHFTKELVYGALLPPLIFEAAFHLKWKELKPELLVSITLATIGVLLAASVMFGLLYLCAGLSWQSALIIGVVLSATDPVSVLALLKESNLTGRVRVLVESESLFNDGTAAVLFMTAISMVVGPGSLSQIISLSVVGVAGGVLIGALIGALCLLLAGRTEDHLVEITVTTIGAFGSFMVAEHFHASGVLSTLTVGLILGNLAHFGAITQKGREETISFWEYAGFISNSLIFLLIGIDLPAHHRTGIVSVIAWSIAASIVGRAIAVYPGCFLFERTKYRVPNLLKHLLFWGGLRGALALALVLGLPPEMPEREMIVAAVFYAVAFSILVQGVTVIPLVKKLGVQT